jgi:hypothetical protein
MTKEKLYGRVLDVPGNIVSTKLTSNNTFQSALDEANEALARNQHIDNQQNRIERLTSRWGTRSLSLKTEETDLTKTLPADCIVVSMIGDFNLANWQSTHPHNPTYIIPGDYHYGTPTGGGLYICDICDSKYIPSTGMTSKTYIYFGNLTNRLKKAQREFSGGDIRSYRHIDFSLYKHLYDPGGSGIPHVTVVACLFARDRNPDTPICLYNINLDRISHHDQLALNAMGVNIV